MINPCFMGEAVKITNVVDNMLFLGSQYTSNNEILTEHKITQVISIGCNPIYENLPNITNYKFDIEDNCDKNNVETFFTNIIPKTHYIINTLLNKNINVLVHCQAGMSRSVIVIITWLMKYRNMNYETAYWYVKEKRGIISPNKAFVDYTKNIFANNL